MSAVPTYHAANGTACFQFHSTLLNNARIREMVLRSAERRSGDNNMTLEHGGCGSQYTHQQFSQSGSHDGQAWTISVWTV